MRARNYEMRNETRPTKCKQEAQLMLTNLRDAFHTYGQKYILLIMRPSSLGGGRILRRTLSVRLSVCLSVRPVLVYIRTVSRAHIQNS